MVKNRNFHIRAQFPRSFCDSAGSRLYQPILYRATVGKLICSYHLYLHMSLFITRHFLVLVVYKSAESSRSSVCASKDYADLCCNHDDSRLGSEQCGFLCTRFSIMSKHFTDYFILNASDSKWLCLSVIQSTLVLPWFSTKQRRRSSMVRANCRYWVHFFYCCGFCRIASSQCPRAAYPPDCSIFSFFAKCMLRGHSLPGGAKGTNGKFGWFRLV